MTELKTLKDFDWNSKTLAMELKKEAIKWVKEDYEQMRCARVGMETMIRRWMKRLNITEEDLK